MAKAWAPTFLPHRLDEKVLDALLRAWVEVDACYLTEFPDTPLLQDCIDTGVVRYIPDDLSKWECWLGIPWILERGGADCKSLVCWRVAELRLRGEDARAHQLRDGDLFHVFVRRGNGKLEDPSTKSGMPYPKTWVWPGA